ncbi:MAG: FixH family protein [Burkholderiaceae bacterium]|nr:FixH family protein [Burkholderiaceae bacterium]
MKSDRNDTAPWWTFGHVWLVIAGPAVVVVAALVTGWIAISHPDTVLAEDYYRRGLEINKTLAQPAGDKALMPAMQGRNHAATPPKAAP